MNNRQKPMTKFMRSLWNILSMPSASFSDDAVLSCEALLLFFLAIYTLLFMITKCKITKKILDFINIRLIFCFFVLTLQAK